MGTGIIMEKNIGNSPSGETLVEWVHKQYSVTTSEWSELEKKLGNLCRTITWQLLRQNKMACIENFDEWNPEVQMALVRAACYYKRQCYLQAAIEHVDSVIDELTDYDKSEASDLLRQWTSKPKNGQPRFSREHELRLDALISKTAGPSRERLVLDSDFVPYAKRIMWNAQKTIGKKLTSAKKEIAMISLDECEFLAHGMQAHECVPDLVEAHPA